MFKTKKGIQLNQAFMAVMTLVLLGVLVIVAIILFSSLDTATDVPNTAGIGVNETITSVTSTGENLSAINLRDGACGTVSIITNSTGGETINSGNYTQSGCLITSITNGKYNNTNWNVTYPYTYSASSDASNASRSMITNFSTYPALVGLVGTIIFLGIVIGVLVASFVFGGNKA